MRFFSDDKQETMRSIPPEVHEELARLAELTGREDLLNRTTPWSNSILQWARESACDDEGMIPVLDFRCLRTFSCGKEYVIQDGVTGLLPMGYNEVIRCGGVFKF